MKSSASSWQQEAETHARQMSSSKEASAERDARSQQQHNDLQQLLEQKVDEAARLQGLLHASEDELKRMRSDSKAKDQADRRATEMEAKIKQLEDKVVAQQQREASLADRLRTEQTVSRDIQERVIQAREQQEIANAKAKDSIAALERSKLLERQALERAQEFRMQLELLREFGHEEFMKPTYNTGTDEHGGSKAPDDDEAKAEFQPPARQSKASKAVDQQMGAAFSSVLIAVELDLGLDRVATISIAPWQSREDFPEVVQAFLQEHRIKPLFKDALVEYLNEVDTQAETYPAMMKANLGDVYSRFG